MSVRWEILSLIVACMAVTIVPRVLPMMWVNYFRPPQWFLAWLSYIPVAVISALFFKEAFLVNGVLRAWHDPYFLAAWATLMVAFFFRNILITVALGVCFFALFRFFIV